MIHMIPSVKDSHDIQSMFDSHDSVNQSMLDSRLVIQISQCWCLDVFYVSLVSEQNQ